MSLSLWALLIGALMISMVLAGTMLGRLPSGVASGIAGTLVPLTLWTVAASIVVHGVTAQPLMRLYTRASQRAFAK